MLGIVVGGGCDLVVQPEQTTVLDNRGSVFAVRTPNAVSVLTDGTLVVQDADLFGLGRRVTLVGRFRNDDTPFTMRVSAEDGSKVVLAPADARGCFLRR